MTSSYELLSGEVRRRRWPRAQKEEIVLETLAEGVSVTEVARRRGIDRTLIYRWRRELNVSRRHQDERFLPIEVADRLGSEDPRSDEDTPEPTGTAGRMEIELACGRRITVFADVDAVALSRVVALLERRPVRRSPGEGA